MERPGGSASRRKVPPPESRMEPERATQVRMRPGQLAGHVARLDAEIIRVEHHEVGVGACREPPLVRQAEQASGVRTTAQDGSRRVGRAGLEV